MKLLRHHCANDQLFQASKNLLALLLALLLVAAAAARSKATADEGACLPQLEY
jgi:hypothetical protein